MEKQHNKNDLIPEPKQLLGVGGYDQLECLAKGELSMVFKARQIAQQQPVAIKILPVPVDAILSVKKLFKRDLLFNAHGSHPNIVQVLDRGFTPARMPFFVMEYFTGKSLDKLIESHSLDFKQQLEIAIQCAKALAYAHQHEMPHGDIKPKNIRVDQNNRAKMHNFGVSALFKESSSTEREDIYALGALMRELFPDSTPIDISNLCSECMKEESFLRPTAAVITERLLQLEGHLAAAKNEDTDSVEADTKEQPKPPHNHDDFWIHNAREIKTILRQLIQNVTTITLSSSGADFILSTLLSIDLKRNLLILDVGVNESRNSKLLEASKITCKAEPKSVEIRFECTKLAKARFKGQSVFVCPIPKTLFYLERREAFRVPTSKLMPPHCIVTLGNDKTAKFSVVDISASGLGMNNSKLELNLQLQETEKYTHCGLYLPEIGETLVSLHLRNFRSITLLNDQKVTRIGAMFFDLTPKTENVIQRYVSKLQIQQIAGSKSS